MKLKSLCMALVTMSLAGGAMAANMPSAIIKVTGQIVPEACSVNFNLPNNTIDFGKISRAKLSATSVTRINSQTGYTMQIDCGSSAMPVGWTAVDANSPTAYPPSVWTTFQPRKFSLGTYVSQTSAENPIGLWWANNNSQATYTDDKGVQHNADPIARKTDGTWIGNGPGIASTSSGVFTVNSLAASGSVVPVNFSKASITVPSINISLGTTKELPLAKDGDGTITFNGQATVQVVYL